MILKGGGELSDNKKIFDIYFDEKFKHLKSESKDIKPLLTNDMILISGDFYGIQKFIFDRLGNKNASKVIRAKSAFIQIFTEVIAKYICEKFGDKTNILSVTAGKFEILSQNKDKNILNEIQKKIDDYFIKNFYGLSGISISFVECKKEDFFEPEKYRKLRDNIIEKIEKKKFNKFNLQNQTNYVLENDKGIDNQSLCRICNIRKGTKPIKDSDWKKCKICNSFINLGEKLVRNEKSIFAKKDLNIEFIDNDLSIDLTPEIKSFVAKDNSTNEILDFDELAENARKKFDDNNITGLKAIAVLKADVDNMGTFIKDKDSRVTESFENFDTFSKTLDSFFSLHIPNKMKKEFPNTYTVFAGGDDLFLVGAWDEILSLARWIEKEFKTFVKSDKLTISFGIAIASPSTPISYLAHHTEHLLEEAKAIDDKKDAITLFGETVKWNSYKKVREDMEALEFFKVENKDINTALLYRLLDFCEMSKQIKKYIDCKGEVECDFRNALWKSKLRYVFYRNMDKKYHNMITKLDKIIDDCPRETKMFLCEFIYKRRG
jgi:CRISPR-associated protein Csm1